MLRKIKHPSLESRQDREWTIHILERFCMYLVNLYRRNMSRKVNKLYINVNQVYITFLPFLASLLLFGSGGWADLFICWLLRELISYVGNMRLAGLMKKSVF